MLLILFLVYVLRRFAEHLCRKIREDYSNSVRCLDIGKKDTKGSFMRRNKSPNSIDGNKLQAGTRYVMKIWPGEDMSHDPKKTTTVTFVKYMDKISTHICTAFEMRDLKAHDSRVCVVKNYKGETLNIGVNSSPGIWSTDEGDRVTFDKLPATNTP
ncbi:MAG: hypothetical protein ABF746_08695 [Acetobacter orientalis]